MNLYLKSGYADVRSMIETDVPFIFIVGGRGTGKTYGALKYILDTDKRFMFMRRTQTQMDIVSKPALSPFKAINADTGYNVGVKPLNKHITAFYHFQFDSEEQQDMPSGAPIGYGCALSTVSNIRGFDGSEIEILVYDEFIGEKHERPIREEGSAFLNCYETLNRNRELKGQKPLKAVLLSNSNDLANPLFMDLKLVTTVEKMVRKGQDTLVDRNRGLAVFILNGSPVSQAKSKTALYRLVDAQSAFYQMAISNEFANEEIGLIKPQNIKEYKPQTVVGELCIYKHKSMSLYYVTEHKSGSVKRTYETGEMELKRFRRDCFNYWLAYLNSHVLFESYIHQLLFEKYYGML